MNLVKCDQCGATGEPDEQTTTRFGYNPKLPQGWAKFTGTATGVKVYIPSVDKDLCPDCLKQYGIVVPMDSGQSHTHGEKVLDILRDLVAEAMENP